MQIFPLNSDLIRNQWVKEKKNWNVIGFKECKCKLIKKQARDFCHLRGTFYTPSSREKSEKVAVDLYWGGLRIQRWMRLKQLSALVHLRISRETSYLVFLVVIMKVSIRRKITSKIKKMGIHSRYQWQVKGGDLYFFEKGFDFVNNWPEFLLGFWKKSFFSDTVKMKNPVTF